MHQYGEYGEYGNQQDGYYQNGAQGYKQQGYDQYGPYQDQQEQYRYRTSDENYRESYPQEPNPARMYQYDERYRPSSAPRAQPVLGPPQQEKREGAGYARLPAPEQQQPLQEQRQPFQEQRQPFQEQRPPFQEQRQPLQEQRQPFQEPPQEHRPPLHEQRQKVPRERILQEPTSPVTLAWDNPFGVFPPVQKKAKAHRRHASLDKQAMSPTANVDQRPHTSHGPQRADDFRSKTSQVQNGVDPPPLASPDLPPDNIALRKRAPGPPGQQQANPSSRDPGTVPGPRPLTNRSHTQPTPPTQSPPFQPSGQAGGYDYNQRDEYGHVHHESAPTPHRPPVGKYASDGSYNSAPPPESFNADSYRGLPLSKPLSHPSMEAPSSQQRQYRGPNPVPDPAPSGLGQTAPIPVASQPQPAYSKPTYQAYSTSAPADTRQFPPTSSEPKVSSALAEFAFDLPPSNPNSPPAVKSPPISQAPARPALAYDSNPNSASNRYRSQPKPDQYGNEVQRGPGPQQGQPPVSQFPPRGASRQGAQPRSAGDELGPSGFREIPGQIPYRPANQDPRGRVNGYGPPPQRNEYDQGFNRPQQYDPRYVQSQEQDYRDQYGAESDPYGSGRAGQSYDQSAPARRPPRDNFGQPPPRPQTAEARRTPPTRGFGEQTGLEHPPPNQERVQTGPSPEGDRGAPVTVAELVSMRESFKNNPNDWALGLRFAQRLVEAASVLASENGRADQKTTNKNRERYIFDAHKVLKKLIASGSPEAMFYLADCYGQGQLGLAPDPKEAFSLYQSAAKLNHPQAAYRVAVCCELGMEDGGGTRRDAVKAMQWYRRAATLGDAPAMYKLGMIMLKGLLGQSKNSREAVTWLKRAADRADRENPHALHELGLLYESAAPNDSIIRDERYALSLFQRAAELGYKYSQFRLGSAWEYGLLGCPIDARQSITWYTRAAAQGEHQSELALSGWYLTGCESLLQQSDREAYLWAQKAASSGLAKAEYAMGYFTEVGIGTAPNVDEARRWYYRAAVQHKTFKKQKIDSRS
ncbi:hypothetical protein DV738_g873, partial [Chaetothyriales sp. CBS 135597]